MTGLPASRIPPTPAFTGPARRLLWVLANRPALVVVGGHPQSSRLSHYFLAAPLLRGEAVLFLDAANCFNPYRLVAFAEQCRRPPGQFLGRVRISRAFTCFQLAELIERTSAAARRYRARHVVLTGMPDIFDDEELAPAEVKSVFTRALAAMRGWPREGLTALAFSDEPARRSPLRARLNRALAAHATAVYRLEESPSGLTLIGAQTRMSAPLREKAIPVGQTFLSVRPEVPARILEVDHGSHGRHLSPVDRAEPGALRPLPARPAARRPAGVR